MSRLLFCTTLSFSRLHLSRLCWQGCTENDSFGNGVNKNRDCTQWRQLWLPGVDLPSDTGDTCRGVREEPKTGTRTQIVNMQDGGTATCHLTQHHLSKMKHRVDGSCLQRDPMKVMSRSDFASWFSGRPTEQGKSTIFVKLPAEAPIFRVSDKQRTLCN